MFPILAHFRPISTATGGRVDVYVGSVPGPGFSGLGGIEWEPAVAPGGRPSGSIEGASVDLQAGIQTASARITLALSQIQNIDASKLYWGGAPVTMYRPDDMQWPAPIEFQGFVKAPQWDLANNQLKLEMAVSIEALNRDLLSLYFDGDGESGGDPASYGTLKPLGIGHCFNVGPLFFDTVRNIGMVDGYGNTLGIDWLGEGLSSFGPRQGDYADYFALAAAIDSGAVKPGQWATSVAAGLIGLGAPPVGVITCHCRFRYGMTGAFMSRLLSAFVGVTAGEIDAAAFAALDTAVPFPIHYWTSEQIQISDLLPALASGCNATLLKTFQGKYSVTRPFGGTLVQTFERDAMNEPNITDWASNDSFDPVWQMKLRTARPVRVMTYDEVNYADNLVDRGLYIGGRTYRQGNIVWLRNKSQWLYINESATAGNAPPDGMPGNAYWENLAPPPNATDLSYYDGTAMEDLKPGEAGADVTGNNTSKDTNAVGGVPSDQIKARIFSLESILAPTGEVMTAFNEIHLELDGLTTTTETITAQINGDSDSYLKQQIVQGATATAALSEMITTLGTNVGALSSSVDVRFGAASDATQAVAQSVTTLTGRVGTTEATLTEQSGVLNMLSGRTLAYWQVEADAGPGGTDAFVTVRAETEPGQPVTSNVAIGAQVFLVFNSVNNQWLKTLEVSGGNVRIYGNLELDGSVVTRNLRPNTVGVFYTDTFANVVVGPVEGTIAETGWIIVGDLVDGGALILFTAGYESLIIDRKAYIRMLIDIDDGNGYQQVSAQNIGVRGVGGADVEAKISFALQSSFAAPRVMVKITGQSQNFSDTAPSGSFYTTFPTVSLFGAKR